ncbi:MAG: VOC family protein [Gammaproteobacteria bacterium]|nr:VOC family protein [Gammaproteobacteria bacterium]
MTRFLTALVALLLLNLAAAEPVAESDRLPIDLRRTTLVVRDIDRSLAFYRDALGMQVIYDNAIRTPREATSDAEARRASRLVFLRANDNFIGIIGLLQYTKPVKPASHQGNEPFSTGSIVLLFNTNDLDATFAKARAVSGVRALYEPGKREYPSYDGEGTIPVMVSVLTDPDGFVIELNQLLTNELK